MTDQEYMEMIEAEWSQIDDDCDLFDFINMEEDLIDDN